VVPDDHESWIPLDDPSTEHFARRAPLLVELFRMLVPRVVPLTAPYPEQNVGMQGQRVGYARCSTDEQDVAIQIEQLPRWRARGPGLCRPRLHRHEPQQPGRPGSGSRRCGTARSETDRVTCPSRTAVHTDRDRKSLCGADSVALRYHMWRDPPENGRYPVRRG
jgi:hypothetical protein